MNSLSGTYMETSRPFPIFGQDITSSSWPGQPHFSFHFSFLFSSFLFAFRRRVALPSDRQNPQKYFAEGILRRKATEMLKTPTPAKCKFGPGIFLCGAGATKDLCYVSDGPCRDAGVGGTSPEIAGAGLRRRNRCCIRSI